MADLTAVDSELWTESKVTDVQTEILAFFGYKSNQLCDNSYLIVSFSEYNIQFSSQVTIVSWLFQRGAQPPM